MNEIKIPELKYIGMVFYVDHAQIYIHIANRMKKNSFEKKNCSHILIINNSRMDNEKRLVLI